MIDEVGHSLRGKLEEVAAHSVKPTLTHVRMVYSHIFGVEFTKLRSHQASHGDNFGHEINRDI